MTWEFTNAWRSIIPALQYDHQYGLEACSYTTRALLLVGYCDWRTSVRMRKEDVEGQGGQRIAAWRVALKSFTSQWFLVPQGTGILSIILHNLHYHFHGLNIISQILWIITFTTLLLFVSIYLLRVALYPRHVLKLLSTDPGETACLASISIAFTTVYVMIALNLLSWSSSWGMVAYVMFWINVVMTVFTTVGIPYVLTYLEGSGIDSVAPSVFLPLISSLTLAVGGGVVCRYGELSADLQVPVIILSYIFLGMALPTSIAFDGVFMARLFDGAYPPQQKVYQIMILCGPPGQASFALQTLGTVVQRGAFAAYNTSSFIGPSGAATIGTASQFLGLLYWGFGTFWWAFACLAIVHYTITMPRSLFKWDQSLAAWSLVFPWGVYTNAAVQLGVVLNSRAFWVWSTVLALLLVMLWLGNAFASCLGIFNGKVLGLDKGWSGRYYAGSAEQEKEEQTQDAGREQEGKWEEREEPRQQVQKSSSSSRRR